MRLSSITSEVVNNNLCDTQQLKFILEGIWMQRSERASKLRMRTFSVLGYLIKFHSVNIQYVRIDVVSLLVNLVVRMI
jgi:hypothetical protein